MQKYNFTMHHLYGENHQYISKILDILQASHQEELFLKKFYATVPMFDLSEEEHQEYARLAKNAYEFLSVKKENEIKIRIYNDSHSCNNSGYNIIEVISDEMPFLFDSTMSLLNRLHIDVERVAHPNIFVTRNPQGELIEINNSASKEARNELVIQIITLHQLDEEQKKRIEQELGKILRLVKLAVDDWKPTLKVLDSYIDKFTLTNKNRLSNFNEKKEFLDMLKEKYFVFFGCGSFLLGKNRKQSFEEIFGILKEEKEAYLSLFDKELFNNNDFFNNNQIITIGKLSKASVIHREANIDYVAVKDINNNGEIERVIVFIGLFTSILYYQSATLIPLIREKLKNILDKSHFLPTSYPGKELISIVEALPRDELFQISADDLHPLLMEIYALLFSPELRLFIRKQADTLSCLLFLPLEAANSDNVRKLKSALSFEFGNIVNHYFSQVNSSKLCYYHFIIDNKSNSQTYDLKNIEQELKNLVRPWENNLNKILIGEFGKIKGRALFELLNHSFPASYKEANIYRKTIIGDIKNIIKTIDENRIIFSIWPKIEGNDNISHLKIYFHEELKLSLIMPMIQNLGFDVTAEQIFSIKPNQNKKEIWLHQFVLNISKKEQEMLEVAKENIEEAFYAMWQEKCQNDTYNQLILLANLNYSQVTLLRALASYLYQVKIGFSKEYLGIVLTKHAEMAKLIISLFYSKFSPKLQAEERKNKVEELNHKLEENLGLIQDHIEDYIIRRFIDLVNNILRTNYFVKDDNNNKKDYVSFKIDSTSVMEMPLPRPYREIYVYSSNFEGIHLRGGKVARGGLRWSDRLEDYRTEILGLMKTQIVKNSVIVPTGAKGGFILKNVAHLDRESLQAKAIECYKSFLSSLLDITDNIVNGKTIHPKNVVRYDDNDPYLVVAADKGTATFSDIANEISQIYNFWLGDAFASGGSKGYDHKKMGITAKGGWISVIRHFHEMGIDINKIDFTVVGIGDMSGDVFGNAMLLSKHIRLVAAFNHLHIFIDPNPDSAKSFEERKRLFNLPRSTWQDYNQEFMSEGGQIYERKAKILHLTPQIKQRFNLNVNTITPEELIKVILTSEVDLLWNGGIGTYVKASFETHEQVGDKTNDNVRCNGAELKCKIVGEGGNLGFTQFGRIEYARQGGRINTDAIDNSAGVDCSDHEVNIKIALRQAMEDNNLTEEERTILLESMTDEVAELVLKDNRTQTRALTIAEHQGIEIMDSQEYFIDLLEEEGILDRKLECLPSKQQFIQLRNNKTPLTRPELSILLACSKNSIYNKLIETSLADEEYFFKDLLLYFPENMRDKFAKYVLQHPLKKEIITTSITNSMVNRIDTFYLHLTVEATGHKFSDIARAYTVTRDLFGLRELWKEINKLDGLVQVKEQVKLYIVIKKFVMRSTNWLLRNYKGKINISSVIEDYKDQINELINIISECALGKYKETYQEELKHFIEMNVPQNLAKKVAVLNLLTSAYNIAEVSNRYKAPVDQVAKIYFELGVRFGIDWLRYCSNKIVANNNWQKRAIRGFKDELYDQHRKITSSAVDWALRYDGNLDKWFKNNEKHIRLYDRFMVEIKAQENVEYAMIDLSLKKLGALLGK